MLQYALLTQAACQGKHSLRMFGIYTAFKGMYPCKKPTDLQKTNQWSLNLYDIENDHTIVMF